VYLSNRILTIKWHLSELKEMLNKKLANEFYTNGGGWRTDFDFLAMVGQEMLNIASRKPSQLLLVCFFASKPILIPLSPTQGAWVSTPRKAKSQKRRRSSWQH